MRRSARRTKFDSIDLEILWNQIVTLIAYDRLLTATRKSSAELKAGGFDGSRYHLITTIATSVLAESYVFPNQSAWDAGVRTVICEIRGTAGRLTGSVRGLG